MKLVIHALLILICVASLASCKAKTNSSQVIHNNEPNVSDSNQPSSSESTPGLPADSFEIMGTVAYKNLRGGFNAIDGDDGTKYDPIILPETYRKNGLKMKVETHLKVPYSKIRAKMES